MQVVEDGSIASRKVDLPQAVVNRFGSQSIVVN